jgi:hypothetical protein
MALTNSVALWWYGVTMEQDTETRQTIRLPSKLLARLRAAADRDHRSVHAQMIVYIERGVAADERKARKAADS